MHGAQLLEREAELRVLETLVAQASGGDGRVGLIEGAPGVGKTSLVSAAVRLAAEAGMRCLSARGSPMERAFPFGVVRQLFEPVLAAGPAERGEVFGGPAARVERLLAGGDEPTAHGGGPFAVYHGLYWLTANLSGAGALALLVDDLQWGDPPSLAAIEYLGRRLEGQTNRQITQRLFITQKTVETHLAHAFRKLRIDSRAQLPTALAG